MVAFEDIAALGLDFLFEDIKLLGDEVGLSLEGGVAVSEGVGHNRSP